MWKFQKSFISNQLRINRRKNVNKTHLSFVFGILLTACLICGCSPDSENKSSGKENITIKISTINSVSWAPMFVASSQGFFAEQGLDVEFITPGGPKGFQAMHAGECAFSMLSQEPLLIAQDKGIKSKIIATMLNSRVYGIITSPEIKNISELKDHVIYASDPGSAPYTFTQNVLESAGLDPDKDVTFMQMNADAAIMALDNGEIKAAFINMSKAPELKDLNVNILVDATREEDCLKYLGTKEFPAEMLCTTEEFAKNHPEICQKVVDAILKAQAWIQEHTDMEVANSMSKHFSAIDVNILAEEVAIMRKVFKTDCRITKTGQAAVVSMCMDTGLISRAIPYEEIVDMSFVDNATK